MLSPIFSTGYVLRKPWSTFLSTHLSTHIPLETFNISFGVLLVPHHSLFHVPPHKDQKAGDKFQQTDPEMSPWTHCKFLKSQSHASHLG